MATAAPAKPAALADEEFNKKWDDLSNYVVLRKSKDPRFGEIIVLKHKVKKELIFAKEKWVNSKDKASSDIADMKARASLNHPSLQRFLGYSSAIDKQLCSTNYLVIGYYDFPKSDAYKEMQDKIQLGQEFAPEELRQIANDGLAGVGHLHGQHKIHGDIRPLQLGYDKDERRAALLDRLNDPSPEDRAQLNNLQNNKELYVSPELWAKLKGKKGFEYSKDKNDLYALGLTLLNLGVQKNIQDIYQPDGGVNRERLGSYLSEFDARYKGKDPALSGLVHSLLAEDEKVRGNEAFRLAGVKTEAKAAPAQVKVSANVPSEVVTHTEVRNEVVTNHIPLPVFQSYGQQWQSQSVEPSQSEGKTVTVMRPDGTTYTYVQRSNLASNVIYNYDQSKLVYVQPFQPVANQQYFAAPVTNSYVESKPSLVVVQRQPQVQVQAQAHPQVVSSIVETRQVQPAAIVSTSVEVRRGSSIPYIGDQKAVLKRYVVKDDKLIEIEVKEDEAVRIEEPKPIEEKKAEAESEKTVEAPAEPAQPPQEPALVDPVPVEAPAEAEAKASEPHPEELKEAAV